MPDIRSGLIGVLVLITALTFGIYLRALDYPWELDDIGNILENASIKSIPSVVKDNLYANRFLGYVSFAINRHFSGDRPASYRWVNILLHVGCGIIVYLLLFAVCRTPGLKRDVNKTSFYGAAFISELFYFKLGNVSRGGELLTELVRTAPNSHEALTAREILKRIKQTKN